jgi:hypothetical protein
MFRSEFKMEIVSPAPALMVLFVTTIALFSCSRAPSRNEVIGSFESAVNAANTDSLLSLFAEKAEVDYVGMGQTLYGKDEIRGKAACDSALHARLILTILRSHKDTVFAQATETNDWTIEAGLSPLSYSSFDFVIKAGQITWLRAELADSSVMAINQVMERLIPWAQKNRPVALDELLGGDFSAEKGSMMAALFRDWRRAAASR